MPRLLPNGESAKQSKVERREQGSQIRLFEAKRKVAWKFLELHLEVMPCRVQSNVEVYYLLLKDVDVAKLEGSAAPCLENFDFYLDEPVQITANQVLEAQLLKAHGKRSSRKV